MNLVSVRLVSNDVKALVAFYEQVTSLRAIWLAEEAFAEIKTPGCTLAFQSAQLFQKVHGGASAPGGGGAILEFLVEDVDRSHEALQGALPQLVQAPTTMPWGNRSLLFRDPDGNLVNLFTPVTPQAVARFRGG